MQYTLGELFIEAATTAMLNRVEGIGQAELRTVRRSVKTGGIPHGDWHAFLRFEEEVQQIKSRIPAECWEIAQRKLETAQ